MNKLFIEIDNHIDISENYIVMIDNKTLDMKKQNNMIEYSYSTHNDKCELCIYAEDMWSVNDSVKKHFSWLSIFDFEFGNTSENLPISSQYKIAFDFTEKPEINLVLSQKDFINVNKDSLSHWNKCSIIQIVLCFLLLRVIVVLFGAIFHGLLLKLFYYIFSLITVASLFIAVNNKRKHMYKYLYETFLTH